MYYNINKVRQQRRRRRRESDFSSHPYLLAVAMTIVVPWCCLLVWSSLTFDKASGFVPNPRVPCQQNHRASLHFRQQHRLRPDDTSTLFRHFMAVQQEQEQEQQQVTALSEAERLRQEALRMRLQAEQMDLNLTLQKIQSLEEKLNNPIWLARHPQQRDDLKEQLRRLNQKLYGKDGNTATVKKRTTKTATTNKNDSFFPSATGDVVSTKSTAENVAAPLLEEPPTLSTPKTTTPSSSSYTSTSSFSTPTPESTTKRVNRNIPPIAGFDDDDLELYIPVAQDINKMVPNATLAERIQLFQQAPELQRHFQAKIAKLVMSPLQDLQRLDELKSEYLDSNSSNERRQIKAQIERIEESLRQSGNMDSSSTSTSTMAWGDNSIIEDNSNNNNNKGGVIGYSDTIYCGPDLLPPLTDDQLEERYQTIQALPDILIAIYKQRTGVQFNDQALLDEDTTADLKLAIQLDYYDLQLQLLEQVRSIDPFTDEDREDFVKAFDSLPRAVQERFAANIGMDEEQAQASTAETVLQTLLESDSPFSHPLLQVVEAGDMLADSEYNDIDFVDRSRFFEEFYPSIANMEGDHPSPDDVDLFVRECLSKVRAFMVTSKPERVVGGYYIRGQNQLSDNPEGGLTSSERLVQEISQKLQEHPTLANKLDFFYILDPSPPTDEEMEMGADLTPILVVTTKDNQALYEESFILTKAAVSFSGLVSTLVFSFGCCVLNPAINDRLYVSADGRGTVDVQPLLDLGIPVYVSLMGILLAHEIGHQVAAKVHKFEIGLPNIIPSITQGLAGTITPLKSPPPNNKALFDFAISGPLCGLAVSVALLIMGLDLTQSMSLDSALPVLPVDFVRGSSLGGGLVEFFLGPTAVLPDQGPDAVIQLHPYAIAGFIGCLINSLALLPLGHTDGGRISLSMFGRRGAFVTKLFTTLLLVLAGVFGLDENNILLTYVLYTLIWQRELETPVRNEVDEIDFSRGLVGIAGALLVGLTLIPMI